jgi:ABC-2 type transport system ATP-binding protein
LADVLLIRAPPSQGRTLYRPTYPGFPQLDPLKMISVRHISKTFGGKGFGALRRRSGAVVAVQNVSFEVAPGQVVGLLGANGAGKTTTIRMITGFLPPDSGRILVAGHDTLGESEEARRAIGYLPEASPAYWEMATADYLDFRARLYSLPRRLRRAAVDSALDRCELQEVRHRRIGHLSRGFRQRVGLAAAIVHNPPVLVLDEPTSALDPRQIRQIRTLIRELAQERAVLVSSHILPEVEQTCDRVIIMARGQVRVDARPGELLDALRDTAPYIVEARSPAGSEAARAALAAVNGVVRIEATEGPQNWITWRLSAAPGAPDLREAIAAAAVDSGFIIRELRRELPTLERIFLEMIEADEGARLGAAQPAVEPKPAVEEICA